MPREPPLARAVFYSRNPDDVAPDENTLPIDLGYVAKIVGPDPERFEEVLQLFRAERRAYVLFVPRISALGDGYREILERLSRIAEVGGTVIDLHTGLLDPRERKPGSDLRQARINDVVEILSWVRDSEQERQSLARRSGNLPGRPWPCRNPECAHPRNTHASGTGACDLCDCSAYRGAGR